MILITAFSPFPTMFSAISETDINIIPPQNKCFWGYTRIGLSVRPSACSSDCVSICVQKSSNYSPANECFRGCNGISLSIDVSVCVQSTTITQSAGGVLSRIQ